MNQQPGISFSPGATGAMGGAPTPAPIHDIVGPLPFFSGPLWIIAVVLLAAGIAGGILWWFLTRGKVSPPTPREAALAALAALREKVSEGNDHDFGVGVSDVLRRFLGEALGLAAPRQTTEEFLSTIQDSHLVAAIEPETLSEFLHQADYLKYARGETTQQLRLSLIEAAELFVLSGSKEESNSSMVTPRKTGQKSGRKEVA